MICIWRQFPIDLRFFVSGCLLRRSVGDLTCPWAKTSLARQIDFNVFDLVRFAVVGRYFFLSCVLPPVLYLFFSLVRSVSVFPVV